MPIAKKVALFLVKIIISLSILLLIFIFIPYKQVLEIIKQAKIIYLFYGLGFFFLCQLFCILRWQTLLHSIGVKIAFLEVTYAHFSGLFFNLFTPSFVVGDIMRGHSVVKKYGSLKKITSSVLMDRFSATIAVTILGVVAFFFGFNLLPCKGKIILPLGIISLLSGVAFLIIFSKRVFKFLIGFFKRMPAFQEKLIHFHDELYLYKQKPKAFLKSLFFSILVQIINVFVYFAIAKAFLNDTALLYFFIFVPIITMIAMLPITVAGLGTRDASMVYFFSIVNMSNTIAISISLFNLVFITIGGIVGGIIYVSLYHRRV